MMADYMVIKRKKMNFSMMVLTDCICIETVPDKLLLEFVEKMGHICELRAVAYKDLSSQISVNNLYNYWHMWKKGEEDKNLESISMKIKFYRFIEDHCKKLIDQYKIKESKYYDEAIFQETMSLIENYYKLDPKLILLSKRDHKVKL
jgi:hypothetical protein